MILYAVEYEGKWKIEEMESTHLKELFPVSLTGITCKTYTLYKEGYGHYGKIWHAGQFFTSYEGAIAYINKDYTTSGAARWNGENDYTDNEIKRRLLKDEEKIIAFEDLF